MGACIPQVVYGVSCIPVCDQLRLISASRQLKRLIGSGFGDTGMHVSGYPLQKARDQG